MYPKKDLYTKGLTTMSNMFSFGSDEFKGKGAARAECDFAIERPFVGACGPLRQQPDHSCRLPDGQLQTFRAAGHSFGFPDVHVV